MEYSFSIEFYSEGELLGMCYGIFSVFFGKCKWSFVFRVEQGKECFTIYIVLRNYKETRKYLTIYTKKGNGKWKISGK